MLRRLTLALLLLPWAECGMCCGGMYATNVLGANASCPAALSLGGQNNTYRQCSQLCCVSHCVGSGSAPAPVGQLPANAYASQCVQSQSEWTSIMNATNTNYRLASLMFSNSFTLSCALECASFTSASVVSAAPMLITAILASLITLLAQRPIE